jgi:hypothetical protein
MSIINTNGEDLTLNADAATKKINLHVNDTLVAYVDSTGIKDAVGNPYVVGGISSTGGTASFAGSGAEITIAHGVGAIPSGVSATPTVDPGGYLGEVWVRKDATNIYVGNSGSFTGSFDWIAVG